MDGDEDVLERGAAQGVGVDVAGDDGLHPRMSGEVAEERVPACVASLEGTLQLDVEALGPEGAGKRGGSVRVVTPEALPRAAGETHEPLVQISQESRFERRRQQAPSFGRVCACAAVSSRQRFAYPWDDSTSSVTWEPPARVTSAPVIALTPTSFAAWASSSEP